MQRDPGAVALLELAGKTGHAKAAGILPESDDPQGIVRLLLSHLR